MYNIFLKNSGLIYWKEPNRIWEDCFYWACYKSIYKKKCCFNLLKLYFMFWKSRRIMMWEYMYSYITYNATLALSIVDVTEPTVLKCLRYYYIIVAVRRIKWLPFWTWAFANRSRHFTRGVCNDHKRSLLHYTNVCPLLL